MDKKEVLQKIATDLNHELSMSIMASAKVMEMFNLGEVAAHQLVCRELAKILGTMIAVGKKENKGLTDKEMVIRFLTEAIEQTEKDLLAMEAARPKPNLSVVPGTGQASEKTGTH